MIKEWLTDSEKRLLFSALAREKKICEDLDREMICCKAVDREYVGYSDFLAPIVESLEQKFYYDKLFNEIEKVAYVKGINDTSVDFYNQALDDFRNALCKDNDVEHVYGKLEIDYAYHQLKKDKYKVKCVNCKHHMYSDMYLECSKAIPGTYPNYNDGCDEWEENDD